MGSAAPRSLVAAARKSHSVMDRSVTPRAPVRQSVIGGEANLPRVEREGVLICLIGCGVFWRHRGGVGRNFRRYVGLVRAGMILR